MEYLAGVLILVLTVVDFTVWAAHIYITHRVHVLHMYTPPALTHIPKVILASIGHFLIFCSSET